MRAKVYVSLALVALPLSVGAGCTVSDVEIKRLPSNEGGADMRHSSSESASGGNSSSSNSTSSVVPTGGSSAESVPLSGGASTGGASTGGASSTGGTAGVAQGGSQTSQSTVQSCGDGTCNNGESAATCCQDCGCSINQVCHDSACITPIDITAGAHHNCALLQDETVECWGNNYFGQLGNGNNQSSAKPMRVQGLAGVIQISAGIDSTCAVATSGNVYCWGRNDGGQLGINQPATSNVALEIKGINDAKGVACGGNFVCVRVTHDEVKCWGKNQSGQLGNGSNEDSLSPVVVTNLMNATSIAAGLDFACARLSDGAVKCWGANYNGQLGNESTTRSSVPVVVHNVEGALDIVATRYVGPLDGGTACSLLGSGRVSCWGANSLGARGSSALPSSDDPPSEVNNLENVTEVAAGIMHFCAAISGGTAKCWGDNAAGQLGVPLTTMSSSTPVVVSNLTSVTKLAAGQSHSCALLSNGNIRCWGDNRLLQLGTSRVSESFESVSVEW